MDVQASILNYVLINRVAVYKKTWCENIYVRKKIWILGTEYDFCLLKQAESVLWYSTSGNAAIFLDKRIFWGAQLT